VLIRRSSWIAVLTLLSGCAAPGVPGFGYLRGTNPDKRWLALTFPEPEHAVSHGSYLGNGDVAVIPLDDVQSVVFEAVDDEAGLYRLTWSGDGSAPPAHVLFRHEGSNQWNYLFQGQEEGRWVTQEIGFLLPHDQYRPLTLILRGDGMVHGPMIDFETWRDAPGPGPDLEATEFDCRGFPPEQ
jgi:hypothetical protein